MVAERSVARGASADPATAASAAAAPVSVELERLPPGDYAWRVAAIGADGRDGHWGAAQPFRQKPPPVAVEPLPATNAATGGGAYDFRWAPSEPGQRYEWQLARRADFGRIVRSGSSGTATLSLADLPPGRHWLRVRAIDADGFESPYGPAQAFDVPYPRWLPYVTATILLIPFL